MISSPSVAASICHVLREDPDLAEAVPATNRGDALRECIARVARMRPGRWSWYREDVTNGGIGLLVLDGLLIREVDVRGGFGAELLGRGDLLRPWQRGEPEILGTSGWRILQPTRIAVLDRTAARRFANYPELTGGLVARSLERARNLALITAISHQPHVDVRLHMFFWHLADRWGHVGPEGTTVSLPLTHDLLAHFVGARRPTVSTALARLANDGLVRRHNGRWVLAGEPLSPHTIWEAIPAVKPRVSASCLRP